MNEVMVDEQHDGKRDVSETRLISRRPRAVLGVLFGLGISVVALLLALRWAGLDELKSALADVNLAFVFITLLTFLVSMLFRVAAWHVLLQRSVPFWRVFAVLNQWYLLNNILPWRLGEFGRALLLGRRPALTVQGVLASIFVERLYDIVIALSFFAALIPLAVGIPGVTRSVFLAIGVLVIAMIGLIILLRYPVFIARITKLLPEGITSWNRHIGRFREGLLSIRNPRTALISFGLLFVSWILAGLQNWFVLLSICLKQKFTGRFSCLQLQCLALRFPLLRVMSVYSRLQEFWRCLHSMCRRDKRWPQP